MFFAVMFCVTVYLLYWWYKKPPNFPPGPRGLPLCGVIPFMTRRPEIKFYEWSKKHGPVFSVRVGRKDWVVLNSYDSITEAMVRQGQRFLARPANYTLDVVLKGKDKGILFSSGKVWEVQRKFGNATFRLFGVGKRSFEKSIQEEASILVKAIEEQENLAHEWRPDVVKAVANVICRVIFGKRFEYDNKLFLNATKDIVSDPWEGMLLNMVILFPAARFLPPVRKLLSKMRRHGDRSRGCFLEEIETHKSNLDPNNVHDFIDAFLVEQEREKEETGDNTFFSDSQLLIYIRDLFGAGSETSSSTLLWCFLALLRFPQYQDAIQAEIHSTIGNDAPSMNHRDKMPFTCAFIQEILRCCTLAPLAVPHCTTADARICGYRIPEATQVMVNIWSVHNNPENFENPSEFRPKRFIDGEGDFIKSSRVIPFLIGPRHCLGEQLARMEIFLFLTHILQKFQIKPDHGGSSQLPAMNDGVLGAAFVPKPYRARFVSYS